MADPARRLATWEDLLGLPEGGKVEILAGEIQAFPRPLPTHGRVQARLGRILGPFDDDEESPGGWWIVIEPDVWFGPHDIVNPDVVGWRRERMPELPSERPVRLAPDWICEVQSPSTASRDRTRKSDLYLRGGVPFYWLVDPDGRTLEAFAAREGAWVRLGGWTDGDVARIAPFDAIEITVGKLFPRRTGAG
ncbi:MAG: Uma2 family endonuclease [Myxococcota bacterium]